MIDWKTAQKRLGVAADGIAGRGTYTALLRVVGPNAKPEVIDELARACIVHLPAYVIDETPARLANFIAQCANETGGFTVFMENLNYRADRLVAIWPRHFTAAQAAAAVGNPVEIASRAYGGRMGNAPYPSQDGYAYRGRGMLQLTGRDNYAAADKRLGIGLAYHPDMAAQPAISLLIACDFWRAGKVNAAIDRGDLREARRITNGGAIGLDHVLALHAKLMAVLG
jgi:putative chitinase